ncbi:MAG TPA: aspartate kinase, partial [Candidatus Caldiarchaeum subterraneum]|nr:aspartate kinase [Candidatus Caldarchaeum subterraneum]
MKFGGTSLGSSESIKRVNEIVKEYLSGDGNEAVVVCSASGDTTDKLLSLVERAKKGRSEEVEELLNGLESHHTSLLDAIGDIRIREEVSEELRQQ